MQRFFSILGWVWVFMVGGLLFTHASISCIICGLTQNSTDFSLKPSIFVIGIASIVIGIIGLRTLEKKCRAR
jgi:hypothetical protein